MKKRTGIRYLLVIICALILVYLINSQPVEHYIEVVKYQTEKVDRPVHDDEALRRQIEEWKQGREQAPIDARLDPVWKAAIPGYNGRIVDVEASLRKLQEAESPSPELLIYREVPPAVSVETLGRYPIRQGNPQKPAISFMINVAWGNEYLDMILDTMDRYQVKTTFFLDGSWVKRYPDLAKKIADRGHEIGNHAYSHPDMSKLGESRIRQEIGRTQQVIEKTLGIKPTLFAPPSGAFNQAVVNISQSEFGMKTILWTADTVDWRKPSVQTLIHRIEPKMGNGVLVLMHPTAPSAEALSQLIRLAKQKGLKPTTVSEVISSRRLP
ncbi:polysaccharide deacetylase family protein [Brevibacillus sp. H7]|uniref:polysaccharide deacetylase family protein n=1 Tax=Brevibacillus sp. H7 TaxID=3349138 RepID=UPI0037F70733